MLHLLNFNASLAQNLTYANTPGVTDGWASLQNGHYLLPRDSWVYLANASGVSITAARLNAPTMRTIVLPEIQPLNAGAISPLTTMPLAEAIPTGFQVFSVDELAAEISTAGAGAERYHSCVWVGDRNFNVPVGNIWTLQATAAITAVANAWTPGSLTLLSTLPKGRYAVVGMAAYGANGVAMRLSFADGGMKPGCLVQTSAPIAPNRIFRYGRLGNWGEFEHTAIPVLETMAHAAQASQTIYLDIVKVR